MAITDALTRLADRQELKGKAYSNFAYTMTAPFDRGTSPGQVHVEIHAHGPNTLGDISFKLVGYNEDDMSDAFIIDQTDIIPQADITADSVFWLDYQITDKPYRRSCILFDVAGGVEETNKDDLVYCPPVPMLKPETKELENTYSAWIVHGRRSNVVIPRESDTLYTFKQLP